MALKYLQKYNIRMQPAVQPRVLLVELFAAASVLMLFPQLRHVLASGRDSPIQRLAHIY